MVDAHNYPRPCNWDGLALYLSWPNPTIYIFSQMRLQNITPILLQYTYYMFYGSDDNASMFPWQEGVSWIIAFCVNWSPGLLDSKFLILVIFKVEDYLMLNDSTT
jgi:hypothetical protein